MIEENVMASDYRKMLRIVTVASRLRTLSDRRNLAVTLRTIHAFFSVEFRFLRSFRASETIPERIFAQCAPCRRIFPRPFS